MNVSSEAIQRMTLGRRLSLAATAIFCSILAVAGAIIYFGTAKGQRANLDAMLISIARSEVASGTDGPNGMVHIHEEGELMLHSNVDIGYVKYAQMEDAQNRVVAQTANLIGKPPLEEDRLQEARSRTGEITFANITLGDEPLRCIHYPFSDIHGHPFLAVIAISRRPVEQSLQTLLKSLSLTLVAGGAAAALCMRFVAQKITDPLQKIAAAARQVGEQNLALRIPQVAQDRELYQVTAVLNQMLERLETTFGEQQALIAAQHRFVADASHELRSPLSNLRSTVEIALRRQRSPEDYRSTLETSLTEIERLSRLVNDLLTLSRADAGQFRLNTDVCDLSESIQRSITAYEPRATEANVRLSFEECDATMVIGDCDRLRQVFDNLLDNALRYAPPGSIIKIGLKQQDNWAIIKIEDKGQGLTQEMQAHVFDRFFRADASRARESGGMGLGLAIVKAIIEAHGGEVSVNSVAGQGATFQITLPLAETETQNAIHPKSSAIDLIAV